MCFLTKSRCGHVLHCFSLCGFWYRSESLPWQILLWRGRGKGEGLSNGLGYQLGRLCCRKLEAKHANLQAANAQSRKKTPKIWNYLPGVAVCLLWQNEKRVLAFFQTDNSNISDRAWKWRVADPKTLNKVAPPWTLIYSLLLQRELKESKFLRCMLSFFVSCPIHIWWSWNLNSNPVSKSGGHFKQ